MESRDESEKEEAHARTKQTAAAGIDETAAEEDMLKARDGSEEEAERETVPPPRKSQAHPRHARTKGHDFSSCF